MADATLDDVLQELKQLNRRADEQSNGDSGRKDNNSHRYNSPNTSQDFDPFGKPFEKYGGKALDFMGKCGEAIGMGVGGAIVKGPAGKMLGKTVADIVGKAVTSQIPGMKNGAKVWENLQRYSFETARNMGLAREQADEMHSVLRDEVGKIAAKFNMNMADIIELQKGYTNAIGRNIVLTNDQMENAAAYKKVLGGVYDEAIASFDALGASTDTSNAYLELTQERAARMGINASEASSAFAKNLEMANKYSFRAGVDGISRMAILSKQLKFNMESIGQAIEKFSTIEDAISTSANLQVLGGTFAQQFSNPLDAMGLAMTDFEGFTDKVIGTFASKGVLNRETGVVEFSPLDKRFMQEAAKQLGMSAEEVTRMASRQVSKAEIDKHMNSAITDESDRSAIESLASFNADTGKYEITYYDEGEAKSIDIADVTSETLKTILPYTEKEDAMAMNVGDIAKNVRELNGRGKSRVNETMSLQELREGWNNSEDAGDASRPLVKLYKSIHDWFGGEWADFTSNNPIKSAWLRSIGSTLGFSEGGTVPGAPNGGKDNTLAMLAPNEMILNERQQSNLASSIPHFASGGISSGDQSALFAMANGAQPRQEKSSGSLLGTMVKTYIAKKAMTNHHTVAKLNEIGKNVAKKDSFKALTATLDKGFGRVDKLVKENTTVAKVGNKMYAKTPKMFKDMAHNTKWAYDNFKRGKWGNTSNILGRTYLSQAKNAKGFGKLGIKGGSKALSALKGSGKYLAKGGKLLGRAAMPIAIGASVLEASMAISNYSKTADKINNNNSLTKEQKEKLLKNAQMKRNGSIGGAVGSLAGAALGTMIPIPVLGPMIGGFIGEKVGSFIGKQLSKATPTKVKGGGSQISPRPTVTPKVSVGNPTHVEPANSINNMNFSPLKDTNINLNLNANGEIGIRGNGGMENYSAKEIFESMEFKKQAQNAVQMGLDSSANMGGKRYTNSQWSIRGGAASPAMYTT